MRDKSKFTYFYVIFIVIIVLFLSVYLILHFNLPMDKFSHLFLGNISDVNSRSSYLVYSRGSEIFYNYLMHKKVNVTTKTKLQEKMMIYTGQDSEVCFYLKSYGYIHIFANTIVYIGKLSRFEDTDDGNGVKLSEIKVEKGKVFMGINTYSDNSEVVVRTDNAFCSVNKSDFFIECKDGFRSNIICKFGTIFYRPVSIYLDGTKEKYVGQIPSVEKYFFDKSRLNNNQMVCITNEDCVLFDKLFEKIYRSTAVTSLDMNYIVKNAFVNYSSISEKYNYVEPYFLYQNNGFFVNTGYVTILTNSLNVKFNNQKVEPNQKYIFLTYCGRHQLYKNDKIDDIYVGKDDNLVFDLR